MRSFPASLKKVDDRRIGITFNTKAGRFKIRIITPTKKENKQKALLLLSRLV